MVPVVLFFFVAFFLIFFIFKLLSPKYSIDFSAFTRAAVAALILGKVSLLLNLTQGTRVGTHRRAVIVAFRTFLYALVVFALIAAERIFHGVRETGSLQGGVSRAIASAHLDHFLGLVLLIGLIVGVYLTMQEENYQTLSATGAAEAKELAKVLKSLQEITEDVSRYFDGPEIRGIQFALNLWLSP